MRVRNWREKTFASRSEQSFRSLRTKSFVILAALFAALWSPGSARGDVLTHPNTGLYEWTVDKPESPLIHSGSVRTSLTRSGDLLRIAFDLQSLTLVRGDSRACQAKIYHDNRYESEQTRWVLWELAPGETSLVFPRPDGGRSGGIDLYGKGFVRRKQWQTCEGNIYHGRQSETLEVTVSFADLSPGCYYTLGTNPIYPAQGTVGVIGIKGGLCAGAPPGSQPNAGGGGNMAFSCGTAKRTFLDVVGNPTAVAKGDRACMVVLSNRMTRDLVAAAVDNRETLAQTFAFLLSTAMVQEIVRNRVDNAAAAAAEHLAIYHAKRKWRPTLLESLQQKFPAAARSLYKVNLIFFAADVSGQVAKGIGKAHIWSQIRFRRACAGFLLTSSKRNGLSLDFSLVYSSYALKDAAADRDRTFARVYGREKRKFRPDLVKPLLFNASCDQQGRAVIHPPGSADDDKLFAQLAQRVSFSLPG